MLKLGTNKSGKAHRRVKMYGTEVISAGMTANGDKLLIKSRLLNKKMQFDLRG